MATLVESWGGVGSNVYVALTEANSYITSAIYDSAAWTDATTAQREAALVEAAIHIDRGHYVGNRYYPDQRLEFPRAIRRNISLIPYTLIGSPDSILQTQMKYDVERAACYQALHICRTGGRDEHAERIRAGLTAYSEAVGPLKEFGQYGGAGGRPSPQVLCQETLDLLGRWREGKKVFRA